MCRLLKYTAGALPWGRGHSVAIMGRLACAGLHEVPRGRLCALTAENALKTRGGPVISLLLTV